MISLHHDSIPRGAENFDADFAAAFTAALAGHLPYSDAPPFTATSGAPTTANVYAIVAGVADPGCSHRREVSGSGKAEVGDLGYRRAAFSS